MTDQLKSRITTDLTGRSALVTGAAKGLGRAIALTLAAAGAKVACIDINAESLAETVGAIRSAGGTAEPMACDVTNSARVDEVVDAGRQALGRAAHSRQQCRHHPRQHDPADERRAVGCRIEHQSEGHFPVLPGGRQADDEGPAGPNHQYRQRFRA